MGKRKTKQQLQEQREEELARLNAAFERWPSMMRQVWASLMEDRESHTYNERIEIETWRDVPVAFTWRGVRHLSSQHDSPWNLNDEYPEEFPWDRTTSNRWYYRLYAHFEGDGRHYFIADIYQDRALDCWVLATIWFDRPS